MIIVILAASTSLPRPPVHGCTLTAALNYRPYADVDSGDCIFAGCTDPSRPNFNRLATVDDGKCASLPVRGCTQSGALNYRSDAAIDDGSCVHVGCTDKASAQYDPRAKHDDGCSCDGSCAEQSRRLQAVCCPLASASNYDPACTTFTHAAYLSCQFLQEAFGCTDRCVAVAAMAVASSDSVGRTAHFSRLVTQVACSPKHSAHDPAATARQCGGQLRRKR